MHFHAQFEDHSAPSIGVIVLQADETLEGEFRQVFPKNVQCLVSRLPSAPEVSSSGLKDMESQIENAVKLFPHDHQFDAIAFACTSGSVEIGSNHIAKHIQSHCQTASVTNPFDALIKACEHLKIKKLAVLSPYVDEVNTNLISAIQSQDVQVVAQGNFNISNERQVVRISQDSIEAAATELCNSAQVDALFLSCTNLHSFELIESLESKLLIPVLSSNQVLAWHLSQLANFKINKAWQLFEV